MLQRGPSVWWRGYILVRRVLSCVCALVVVYIEYRASVDNRAVLYGAVLPPEFSNSYYSPLVEPFLQMLVSSGKHSLVSTNASTTYVYMDQANDSSVQFLSSCLLPLPGDDIYSTTYLDQLLGFLLSLSINDSYVVIDCQYTGRVTQDTTALKVHLLDYAQTNFTTIFLQTMMISRPSKYRQAACGTATIASIPLHLINAQDMTLIADTTTSVKGVNDMYTTLVGVDFPYETSSPFKLVTLTSDTTKNGAWQAYMGSEAISLQGTEGIYRTSVHIQGNYDYYVWDLPSNPLEFASVIHYINSSHSRDSYAWLRLLIGLGITLNIAITFLVALLTTFHLYKDQQIIWIPDLFPCIQHRVKLRAILCWCVLSMTDWWHIFEWSLAQTNSRLGLTGTFVLPYITISDSVMVALAIFTSFAHLLEVRIGLEVVLLILYVCFQCQEEIIDAVGICKDATDAFALMNFQENTFASEGSGMGLWAYHEMVHVEYCVILTAFTWWFLGVILSCVYVFAVKAFAVYEERRYRYIGWQHIHIQSKMVSRRRSSTNSSTKVAVGPRASRAGIPPHKIVLCWFKRSILYHPFVEDDQRIGSQVERSARALIEDIFGLVAAFEDEDHFGYVSISSIWLLGYVILNDRWLISIRDYPRWLLNVLFRRNIFSVYGHQLDEYTSAPYKERVPYIDDLSAKERIYLTLRPLT